MEEEDCEAFGKKGEKGTCLGRNHFVRASKDGANELFKRDGLGKGGGIQPCC